MADTGRLYSSSQSPPKYKLPCPHEKRKHDRVPARAHRHRTHSRHSDPHKQIYSPQKAQDNLNVNLNVDKLSIKDTFSDNFRKRPLDEIHTPDRLGSPSKVSRTSKDAQQAFPKGYSPPVTQRMGNTTDKEPLLQTQSPANSQTQTGDADGGPIGEQPLSAQLPMHAAPQKSTTVQKIPLDSFVTSPVSVQASSSAMISASASTATDLPDSSFEEESPVMTREPETRRIPIVQLRQEMSSISALVQKFEEKTKQVLAADAKKLRELDERSAREDLSAEERESITKARHDCYKMEVSFNRELLQEYYDLFRASSYATKHPEAPPDLKNYAERVSLPARLWRYGVHHILEHLRVNSEAREFLEGYILLSYQTLALLQETVPEFSSAWIESLGDISRYRMAIEHVNFRERESWRHIAYRWYLTGIQLKPEQGRLIHHCAILSRGDGPWKQLSLYARSLTSQEPFLVARGSIEATVFKSIGSGPFDEETMLKKELKTRFTETFINLQVMNYHQRGQRSYNTILSFFFKTVNQYISFSGAAYEYVGETVAIVNIAALLQWGQTPNPIRNVLDPKFSTPSPTETLATINRYKQQTFRAWYLTFTTFTLNLKMLGDEAVLPHIHVMLAFLYCLAYAPCGYGPLCIRDDVPWPDIASFLNSVQRRESFNLASVRDAQFVHAEANERFILPEDITLRGLCFTQSYFRPDHFSKLPSPEEDTQGDRASNPRVRGERIIWCGLKLADIFESRGRHTASPLIMGALKGKPWLAFDKETSRFLAH